MSDIKCANCREPWDTYHMRHEALVEVAPKSAARAWDGKLDSVVHKGQTARLLLSDDRWAFGASIYDVRRCPCCPKGAKPAKNETRDELVALMGDDEDGIASTLEELDGY